MGIVLAMASASFDITPPWRNTRAPTSNVAGKFPNEMSMEMNNNIYKSLINGAMGKTIYLVGGIPTPLKNMSSSVGMMTFPIYGKS